MKFDLVVMLYGLQTGKTVAAPVKEQVEAETLSDALIRVGEGLRNEFNNDIVRAIGVTLIEAK